MSHGSVMLTHCKRVQYVELMSRLDQHVVAVAPRTVEEIHGSALALLRRYAPSHLFGGGPLDVDALLLAVADDYALELEAVEWWDLYPALAEVDQDGPRHRIRVREDRWDGRVLPGPHAKRTRAALAHELAHVVLHFDELARGRVLHYSRPRHEIPAESDPEWQAWTWAGCLLVPTTDVAGELAEVYGVSAELAAARLRREI